MAIACILFILAGIVSYFEHAPVKTSIALICIGVANALLLWEARP